MVPAASAHATGPRFLEAHAASKVSDKSLQRYREAVLGFSSWCVEREYDPQEAAEWDDLLAEYLYSHPKMKRSVFGQAVAGVEFFFFRLRGHLKRAHACLTGWGAGRRIRHTVPHRGRSGSANVFMG